jgi:hypothetical protein
MCKDDLLASLIFPISNIPNTHVINSVSIARVLLANSHTNMPITVHLDRLTRYDSLHNIRDALQSIAGDNEHADGDFSTQEYPPTRFMSAKERSSSMGYGWCGSVDGITILDCTPDHAMIVFVKIQFPLALLSTVTAILNKHAHSATSDTSTPAFTFTTAKGHRASCGYIRGDEFSETLPSAWSDDDDVLLQDVKRAYAPKTHFEVHMTCDAIPDKVPGSTHSMSVFLDALRAILTCMRA